MVGVDKENTLVKTYIGGSCSVSLIVGDNFDLSVLENTNTGVGSSKINTNCGFLCHFDWISS